MSLVCSYLVKKNSPQLWVEKWGALCFPFSFYNILGESISQQEDIDISTSLVEKAKGGEVYFSQAYLSL